MDPSETPRKPETALEIIAERANLPRITDIQQDENYYRCTYDGTQYLFKKDTASTVEVPPESSSGGQAMKLIQKEELDPKFTQDQFANREFFEVMMFHEIREAEYLQGGLADAHQRALHDEMLYVVKYLGEARLVPYFQYADKYRQEALEKQLALEAQREEERRMALEAEERTREAERQRLQDEARLRAEQALQDVEEAQQEEIVRRAQIELFYKNRPSLAQFRARAMERLPQLSDPFKNAFLRKKIFVSDGKGGGHTSDMEISYLTEWYTPYAGRPKSEIEFFAEGKASIRGARYRKRAITLVDYLNGWRKKGAKDFNRYYRKGSLDDRERIEGALAKGTYVSSVGDAPAQIYSLSPDERKHLQDILYLFEITKRESKKKDGLTFKFLQHLVLKSDALIEHPWPNIEYYLNPEETEGIIASNDQEEAEYRAIIAEIVKKSSGNGEKKEE